MQSARLVAAVVELGALGRSRSPAAVDRLYPNGYVSFVYQIRQSDVFSHWLSELRDARAKARVIARIDSARFGNLGDTKSVGGGVHEMRIHVGAGYRIYFARTGKVVLLLLCGGDKSSQARDIARAKRLLTELGKE